MWPWKYVHVLFLQVPVAGVSSGVHDTGKTIDKTETLFSQERDPRFAEMYTSISGCMYIHAHIRTHTNVHLDCFRFGLCVTFFYFIFFQSGWQKDDGSVLHSRRTATLYSELSLPAGPLWQKLQVDFSDVSHQMSSILASYICNSLAKSKVKVVKFIWLFVWFSVLIHSSSVIHVPGVNDIQSSGSSSQNLAQISRQLNPSQVAWSGNRPPFAAQVMHMGWKQWRVSGWKCEERKNWLKLQLSWLKWLCLSCVITVNLTKI